MGDETPTVVHAVPSMPQNTVVFNGAAFNLMSTLFEGVRSDVRDMKIDLTKIIDDRYNLHEETHVRIRKDMSERTCRYEERLDKLEDYDQQADNSAKIVKARRDGQMWAFTTGVSIIDRYGKWILMTLIFLGGLLAGAIGHFQITFGA